jgi:pSer/pThr/pTyr-binding forkhead associated (FHA) protein
VPIVFAVDGVRADFPNHKLQIAVHHSDTPKALRYEAVIAERKGGGAVGRLDRAPLTLRNGILETPMPAAMEETDRPTEYLLMFRLYTDKKLVGEQRKEFVLPAPPRPNIVERARMALETYPWLGWSIAGIVALLALSYAVNTLVPRKRKPLPRPQNLAPVLIQSPPLLSPSLALAVAYAQPGGQTAAPPEGADLPEPQVDPAPGLPLTPLPTPNDAPPGPPPTPPNSTPGGHPLLTVAFDPGTAALIVTSGSGPSSQHILTQPEVTIGRADDNDIVIKDSYASRRHARIARQDNHYVWIDRDEVTQPTRINGKAIRGPQALQHGDEIEVGETTIVFQWAQPREHDATEPRRSALPTQARGVARPLALVIGDVRHPLSAGMKLDARAIGANGAGRDGALGEPIAEVTTNPNDRSILGLRNLSGAPWKVTLPAGQTAVLETGRSVRLEDGVKIDFGAVEGRVQA